MKLSKKTFLFISLLALGLLILPINLKEADAASSMFRESKTDSALFAVPEGGWASIYVEVSYQENYTTSGNNNILNKRYKTALFRASYATSKPYITLGNAIHSNGKTFSSWTSQSSIYGQDWDGCLSYYNSTSVTYSNKTSITGKLAYTLSCDGSVVPVRAGSVDLSLK